MAHELRIALWVTEDGTWGKGPILLVDDAAWSEQQRKWLDKHIDEYGEPDIDVVTDIDINIEPEWEEE
jgi:hypothetical protein